MYDPNPAAETEYPSHQLSCIGYRERHAESAIFQFLGLLTGMPDSVFRPGRGHLVEEQFDLDLLSLHDHEGILNVGLQIEVQRHLIGMVRQCQRLDALDREHPHVFSPMAVGDEIEPSSHVAKTVRIDLASHRDVA
jgi:hypothetical protein